MRTVDLKKYLSEILGREQALFTMQYIQEDIEDYIKNSLKATETLQFPTPPTRRNARFTLKDSKGAVLCVAAAIICAIIGFFTPDFWDGAVLMAVAGFVVFWMQKRSIERADDNAYHEAQSSYESAKKIAEQKKQIIVKEQSLVLATLRQKKRELDKHIDETQSALNALYSLDIVFGKYRYFVAVASFCEYLQSGRCSSLEGHEGAYNIYESELRQNIIIGQLNTVIKELQQIRNAQYLLYEAINESNRIQEKIANELYSINQSIISSNQRVGNSLDEIKNSVDSSARLTELTAFFTKEAANNSRLLVEINRGDFNLLHDKTGSVVH